MTRKNKCSITFYPPCELNEYIELISSSLGKSKSAFIIGLIEDAIADYGYAPVKENSKKSRKPSDPKNKLPQQ